VNAGLVARFRRKPVLAGLAEMAVGGLLLWLQQYAVGGTLLAAGIGNFLVGLAGARKADGNGVADTYKNAVGRGVPGSEDM